MYENIPDELKVEKAWVNTWNGKKIPMQSIRLQAASSSNPETWSHYTDAEIAIRSGMYDRIGYVLHDTGLIGIDIDMGFEDGLLTPLAADIINQCESYTEYSCSKRGIHIILKGTLPWGGRNNGAGVEMYATRRFFIMTGNCLFNRDIVANQGAIDYIVDKFFLNHHTKESHEREAGAERIYTPMYARPKKNKIYLDPTYATINQGARNINLTSLAGQLYHQGYSISYIKNELIGVNEHSCTPPLPCTEIEAIVKSILKYER